MGIASALLPTHQVWRNHRFSASPEPVPLGPAIYGGEKQQSVASLPVRRETEHRLQADCVLSHAVTFFRGISTRKPMQQHTFEFGKKWMQPRVEASSRLLCASR
jgi:hypothetical protein